MFGSVWAWRPVPPSIPSQLLRKKRLQPLGWVFTTTAAPPDVENIAVVSEAYLDPVSEKVFGEPEEAVDLEDEAHSGLGGGKSGRPVSQFIQATVGMSAEAEGGELTIGNFGSGDLGSAACKFVVDSSSNFLFLSRAGAAGDLAQYFYRDHEGLSSLFRLKKQVAPAEQMDDIARSSRYAPHLHSLMQSDPPQAHSDPIACAAVLSSRY